MSAQQEKPVTFQPIGAYALPTEPTEDLLHRLLSHAGKILQRSGDEPAINGDKLLRSKLKDLDRLAAPPACGPLLKEMQTTFGDWASDADPAHRTRLVVLPPGDENRLVETWAEQHGHTLVPPPARADLINRQLSQQALDALPVLSGEDVLVIPNLERWFLRHRNGLTLVRELLSRIDGGHQRCLVSCNSWAWAYLTKAVNADLVLSGGMTFQAFGAARLQDWFAELAADDHEIEFRLSQSGENLFADPGDEPQNNGKIIGRVIDAVRSVFRNNADQEKKDQADQPHSYFIGLAARSFGIPWVAWHIWRRSLYTESEIDIDSEQDSGADAGPDDAGETASDRSATEVETLWVEALEEFSLPGSGSEQTLLVLQALLIHGRLTVDELYMLLPATRELNSLPALARDGLIERRENHVSCRPAAYPAIRNGLSTAGFPLDRM